ncbi:MAG: hypothetical protein BMS9Abin32_360 [Gammaproteobacteria bacterium]|nr:MAG: hypothetical protein BMS9Abin32_360 [Gammaproteobacteria bacterium]
MPAKKTASRKRKAAGSRSKAASRRPAARKKSAAKKRTVTRKKSSAKKSSKKKTVARKKPAAKKKAIKKPAAKKKAASRKSAKKKPVAKKKPAARKASSRKAPAAKARSGKKAGARKAPVRRQKKRSDILTAPIHGVKPYAVKPGEEYMSPGQLKHFAAILTAWKRELMREVDRTVHHMQDEAANFPDPNDRATQESEFGLELRTRDRERKLLRKITSALARVDDCTYGYCEQTGEEIGLKRLEARPVATLSVEAQERREVAERQFRDRDDRYR